MLIQKDYEGIIRYIELGILGKVASLVDRQDMGDVVLLNLEREGIDAGEYSRLRDMWKAYGKLPNYIRWRVGALTYSSIQEEENIIWR